jgi:multicomponent Na+:H+ antiporter subunit D
MISSLAPGLILCLGGFLIPLLKGNAQRALALALPLLSFANLVGLGFTGIETGLSHQVDVMGYTMVMARVDKLSLIFGYIFHVAALLSVIYSLHVDDAKQMASGTIYAGAGIGAVFSGDLITLFVFWEVTAFTSVFLIWAANNERANKAAIRYLVVQVASGVLLLAGAILHYQATGSLAFGGLNEVGAFSELLSQSGPRLILLSFAIKCAFPFLHNWLQDAYPKATATGTVFLSAFTTKLAVYTLIRGFAGFEALIYVGVVMTLFPIFFAVVENDLRKVLAYSLNNQLGFMVVAVGVGSEMAINGACAHAFAHILYKALLFMSMGAVLHRVGTTKASQLGGLYRSMPVTAVCCIIGAASISAFPLTSGFISKALTLQGVMDAGYAWIWGGLLIASAGVMEHSGIKIPFFAFFGHDSGIRCERAPLNMQIAMGITAALCILIGCFPGHLYALLPYATDYKPYTAAHIVTQFQLLLFAMLAFVVLMKYWGYPDEEEAENLDTDWFYRRAFPAVWRRSVVMVNGLRQQVVGVALSGLSGLMQSVQRHHGPGGVLARTWAAGTMVMLGKIALALYLAMYLLT